MKGAEIQLVALTEVQSKHLAGGNADNTKLFTYALLILSTIQTYPYGFHVGSVEQDISFDLYERHFCTGLRLLYKEQHRSSAAAVG